MNRALCFCIIVFGLHTYLNAQTVHSFSIQDLQEEFGNHDPSLPIVFMDKDKIYKTLFEQSNENTTPNKVQVITDFIQQTSDQIIDQSDAETIKAYLEANIVSSLRIKNKERNINLCVVIPSDPNLNQIQSSHRLLHFADLHKKPEYLNKRVSKSLSRKDNALISNLHETFHCFDRHFLPNSISHVGQEPEVIHKSETFAEVGAFLYLFKKGYRNLIDTRIDYRLVGSYMSGKYLKNPFSNLPWGTIYSLYKPLNYLKSFLDRSTLNFTKFDDLINLSHSITLLESFNGHEFYGIKMYQEEPKYLEKFINENRDSENIYLKNRIRIIEAEVKTYKPLLKQGFLNILKDSIDTYIPKDNGEYDLNKSCLAFYSSQLGYEEYLDNLRQEHYQENQPEKGATYSTLVNLHKCGQQSSSKLMN